MVARAAHNVLWHSRGANPFLHRERSKILLLDLTYYSMASFLTVHRPHIWMMACFLGSIDLHAFDRI